MRDGYSIYTYYRWTVSVPVGLGVAVSSIIFMILVLVSFLTFGKRNSKHLTNFFFMCSKIVYRDALRKKKNPYRVLFHGYKFRNWHMVQCASIILIVVVTVFLSFWANFLTEATYICNPQLDCFFSNSSILWIIDNDLPQRVDDCANIDDNISVICYQFAFTATKGFSSAVGFLAVAVIYTYMYGYVLIWFMEIVLSPKVTNVAIRMYSIIGWLSLIILPLVIGIAGLVVVMCVPFLAKIAFKSFESGLTFLAYWCFFVYAGPLTSIFTSFALWGPVKIEMRRDYGKEVNNNTQHNIEQQRPTSAQPPNSDTPVFLDTQQSKYQSFTTSQTNC